MLTCWQRLIQLCSVKINPETPENSNICWATLRFSGNFVQELCTDRHPYCCTHVRMQPCQLLCLSRHTFIFYPPSVHDNMSVCLSCVSLSCLPACGLLRSCRGQSRWWYAPGKTQWRASVAFISLENAQKCLSLQRSSQQSLLAAEHVHFLHSTQNLIHLSRFLHFLLAPFSPAITTAATTTPPLALSLTACFSECSLTVIIYGCISASQGHPPRNSIIV